MGRGAHGRGQQSREIGRRLAIGDFKELNIINARAALPTDFPESIKLVEGGKVNLEPFITHTFPLADVSSALQFLMEPNDERLKVILEV